MLFKDLFLLFLDCGSLWECVISTVPSESKRGANTLEPELQMVVSHPTQMLGTELGSSGKAAEPFLQPQRSMSAS